MKRLSQPPLLYLFTIFKSESDSKYALLSQGPGTYEVFWRRGKAGADGRNEHANFEAPKMDFRIPVVEVLLLLNARGFENGAANVFEVWH